jgi:RNA-directed DNA polymerase
MDARSHPTVKEVLRKWLKAGFIECRTLLPTEAGTPQGGIISPTLVNLTLDGLERLS